MTLASAPAEAAPSEGGQRRALGVGCGAHALHDGFTDLIYILLPIWQAEFGLSYAALGALRSLYIGTMALVQMPAATLSGRIGAPIVLAVGTALTGLCYCLAGASSGFSLLLAALLLGGVGAATQHPIASALVARAFEGPRSITALGAYNFWGDIGKMALPLTAIGLLLVMPWRPMVALFGVLGLAAAVAIFLLTPREIRTPVPADAAALSGAPSDGRQSRSFWLLLAIAAIDSISRAGFLVWVPFLLIGKGASVSLAGFGLTLTLVGGAAGKLACAHIGARFGIIGAIAVTEVLTALGILAMLALPLVGALLLMPLLGIVLNGTSSLTYGSVPAFTTPAKRDRAFGIFYTGTIGAGALAPAASGAVGDLFGLRGAVVLVALLALAALPIAWMLRRDMEAATEEPRVVKL